MHDIQFKSLSNFQLHYYRLNYWMITTNMNTNSKQLFRRRVWNYWPTFPFQFEYNVHQIQHQTKRILFPDELYIASHPINFLFHMIRFLVRKLLRIPRNEHRNGDIYSLQTGRPTEHHKICIYLYLFNRLIFHLESVHNFMCGAAYVAQFGVICDR